MALRSATKDENVPGPRKLSMVENKLTRNAMTQSEVRRPVRLRAQLKAEAGHFRLGHSVPILA